MRKKICNLDFYMPDEEFKKEIEEEDDCEVCKLMKTGNVTPEALEKAFSLQNFLNNFSKDQDKKK